jgi:O-antigen/teichoic acid export membrane protein
MGGGIVDAALSSLATFTVGLVATRTLSPADLGSYAIAFSGFLAASGTVTQLVFVPTELAALRHEPDRRLGFVRSSIRQGAAVAVVTTLVVSCAVAVAISLVGHGAVLGPVVTLAVTGLVSPLQDHLRRLLHQAHASRAAALVALTQLTAVVAALAGLHVAGVPDPWIPFGALAVGNICSLAVGLELARARRTPVLPVPPLRTLVRTGRWLLAGGIAEIAAGFGSIVLLAAVAGSETAGFAEAARILSQPLYVLCAGLLAVLGPELTVAAAARDRERASRLTVVFCSLLGTACVVHLLVAGVEWGGSPLVSLFPSAYEENGLVAAMIVAQGLLYLSMPFQAQALGVDGEDGLFRTSVAASGSQIVGTGSAVAFGALGLPFGIACGAVARHIGLRLVVRRRWAVP